MNNNIQVYRENKQICCDNRAIRVRHPCINARIHKVHKALQRFICMYMNMKLNAIVIVMVREKRALQTHFVQINSNTKWIDLCWTYFWNILNIKIRFYKAQWIFVGNVFQMHICTLWALCTHENILCVPYTYVLTKSNQKKKKKNKIPNTIRFYSLSVANGKNAICTYSTQSNI